MSEKQFENDGEKVCSFDYTLLDTYYEARDYGIIEFNKRFDNIQYHNFQRIAELLNIKQMKLESCQKRKKQERNAEASEVLLLNKMFEVGERNP